MLSTKLLLLKKLLTVVKSPAELVQVSMTFSVTNAQNDAGL